MAVRVRLTRVGNRKNPVWRVVVADQRSPRDGRVIETVGRYNAQTHPSEIVLDRERVRHWLARGAQPSGTVKKLLRAEGLSPSGADRPEGARVTVAPEPAVEQAAPVGAPVTADGTAAEAEAPSVEADATAEEATWDPSGPEARQRDPGADPADAGPARAVTTDDASPDAAQPS